MKLRNKLLIIAGVSVAATLLYKNKDKIINTTNKKIVQPLRKFFNV